MFPTDESSEAVLEAARSSFHQAMRRVTVAAFLATSMLAFVANTLASRLTETGVAQRLLGAGLLAACSAPIVVVSLHIVIRQLERAEAATDAHRLRLEEERRHRSLESQVSDGLEMADTEAEALRMIERGFGAIVPSARAELLLADNSHARLTVRAAAGLETGFDGCGVRSPSECPAARRARVHTFPDSRAVNACPKLGERAGEPCSAVCIPVSVMGRTVGVIHTVRPASASTDLGLVEDLQALANQAGTRLGVLRVMAETQLQAETDNLTGLLNRRAFDNAFVEHRNRTPHGSGVLAMADLDHFKVINDTYGHGAGDRALRIFADTLRRTVRSQDVLSRRGGEEFAILFPDCDVAGAEAVLERLRSDLERAVRESGLPAFTASFGLTPLHFSEELDFLLARADAALFEAKRSGRDRIITFTAADVSAADINDAVAADDHATNVLFAADLGGERQN